MNDDKQESMRDISRKNIHTKRGNVPDVILSGSIMRIADSLEIIAKDRHNLEQELRRAKDYIQEKNLIILALKNKMRSLKGHNTRLKNKQ